MLYLDTSLLVALITTEERTARAHDWLAGVDDDLAILRHHVFPSTRCKTCAGS